MSGYGIGVETRASVRPSLGHGIGLDIIAKLIQGSKDIGGSITLSIRIFGIVGASKGSKKAWKIDLFLSTWTYVCKTHEYGLQYEMNF
ncbi:Outer membrane C [Gossypium arboreum]|uniref:Outer membrane C n=1 Tax=Gossypium arboreum TaxID=29729 RepID=A0A0B0P602_GOSAR|nr:Outer membrane C [Gossypium arboreum]